MSVIEISVVVDDVARGVAVPFERVQLRGVGDVPVSAGDEPLVTAALTEEFDGLLVESPHVFGQELNLIADSFALALIAAQTIAGHVPGVVQLHAVLLRSVVRFADSAPGGEGSI